MKIPEISYDASHLYDQYSKCLQDWTGLKEDIVYYVGFIGARLFEAEYKIRGDAAYSTSIVQPIRNAAYMAHAIENRWTKLKRHTLNEPLLDYGCGVGFTSAWLVYMGIIEKAYVYEPPGTQREFLEKYGQQFGLTLWEPGCGEPNKFGTVLCINVLEHMEDPMGLLERLRTLAPKVIANCVLSEDETHIAGQDIRLAVNKSLWERGEHLEIEGSYNED